MSVHCTDLNLLLLLFFSLGEGERTQRASDLVIDERRIFEREGQENLIIMKTKKKRSSLRFSPFFYPDLGEDQKKSSSLRFSAFFCPYTKGGGA